ncbi:MAG: 3'-5' exonuclease [Thermomicrobium sp.]|nr:3'-5' exonuclease [Thermomicrobium sp.]
MSPGKGWRAHLLMLIRAFARISESECLFETAYTVLDAEMTGLAVERDELLAIGAVRMIGPRILLGERFYTLIRPSLPRWGGSVTIHGIRPEDVATAPDLTQVLPRFADFINGTVLIGHGVEVDRRFLERAAQRLGLPLPPARWIDTGRVARWLVSQHGTFAEASADRGRFGLEELLEAYGIDVPARHHALADAFATAQLWQRLLWELTAAGVRTMRDLRLIGLC